MFVARVPVPESAGHLLLHNVAGDDGRKALAKGTRLAAREIELLQSLGHTNVVVAVLDAGDVHEDEAGRRIAAALTGDGPARMTDAVGGRVNFHSDANAILHVDGARLTNLNLLPGVALATRLQHSVTGAASGRTLFATLKIVPLALPAAVVEKAVALAPGVIRLAPLRPHRVALLVTAGESIAARIVPQFDKPTRARLARLESELVTVRAVDESESAIRKAASELLRTHDGLIVAGQTSIMDAQDTTLAALRAAGVDVLLHGVPVEPGNMMAIGYEGARWILCAPGCARSPKTNVVDLVLPRLLAGERLDRRDTAELGLGGLL